jgi:hypothetical protein
VLAISGNLALLRDGRIDQFGPSGAFEVAQVPGAVAVAGAVASDSAITLSNGLLGGVTKGGEFGLVLKSDGSLWAASNNAYGELGNGTTTNSSTPVQVNTQGLPVSEISAGDGFAMATVGLPVTQWHVRISRGGRFAFTVDHGRIIVGGHATRSRRLVGTIRR